MPTYEYICEKCGHQFEVIQSIAAEPLRVCPKESCGRRRWGKGKVKRAISGGAGLLFKGSGFYITDYRSSQYKEAAKKEAQAGKSDAKTAGAASKPASGAKSSPAGSKPSSP